MGGITWRYAVLRDNMLNVALCCFFASAIVAVVGAIQSQTLLELVAFIVLLIFNLFMIERILTKR